VNTAGSPKLAACRYDLAISRKSATQKYLDK
jgi:hypothetical protein